LRFAKWHGLGNDYLLVERDEVGGPLAVDLVRRLCDYHFGVGSDGFQDVGLREAVDELYSVFLGTDHDQWAPFEIPPLLESEALQNAIKYSGAREVSVRIIGSVDALTVSVIDDGVGFDVDATWDKGLGLISMNERLEAVGGTLEILATPGTGCRVTARVPLVRASQPARSSVRPRPKTMTAH